jgi:hypothetical protein
MDRGTASWCEFAALLGTRKRMDVGVQATQGLVLNLFWRTGGAASTFGYRQKACCRNHRHGREGDVRLDGPRLPSELQPSQRGPGSAQGKGLLHVPFRGGISLFHRDQSSDWGEHLRGDLLIDQPSGNGRTRLSPLTARMLTQGFCDPLYLKLALGAGVGIAADSRDNTGHFVQMITVRAAGILALLGSVSPPGKQHCFECEIAHVMISF